MHTLVPRGTCVLGARNGRDQSWCLLTCAKADRLQAQLKKLEEDRETHNPRAVLIVQSGDDHDDGDARFWSSSQLRGSELVNLGFAALGWSFRFEGCCLFS